MRWVTRCGRVRRTAGIRLTLLDTCYLSSGFGRPPAGVQVRYSDGTAAAWVERVGAGPAAIHSVRAVPRAELHVFRGRDPLHVHLSEQPPRTTACLAAYGVTPTRLLHDEGLLGPGTTVVHATHLTDQDVALLGGTRTNVCLTPTTERDLATASGRRGACPTPAAGSPSVATATRSSTRSRRCVASSSTSDSRPASGATGPLPTCWTSAALGRAIAVG